ncbi:hypothetical protein KKF91_06985 [Myxococcota bacterium]|nr:hypothetical protein [Myxococcota bacterium]MBU1430300.1 hypothetical protein [Myxococcota bacterium]MBU1896264.1 hypothetical protein [Myxococcota bacterium]
MRLLLIGLSLLLGACSTAKRYEAYQARCAATHHPHACYTKGRLAEKLGNTLQAHEGYSEACLGGHAAACKRLKAAFPKTVALGGPPRPLVQWHLDSKPKGARLSWRLESATPEVAAVPNTALGATPFEATRQLQIEGLTVENASAVTLVIEATIDEATQIKRLPLQALLRDHEVHHTFELRP